MAVELDQKTQVFMDGFGQLWGSLAELSTAEKRARMREMYSTASEGEIRDELIDGPNGQIPLRIFFPEGSGPFPVMVFFHHGGWVFGSIDESAAVCRNLADRTRNIVVAVDYCLAPENPYPAPLEDAYAATKLVTQHVFNINGDPQRIGVGGESAGGNLAAAVCLLVRERQEFSLAFQGLFYPIMTCDLDPKAYENNLDPCLITLDNMQWFYDQYLTHADQKHEPTASPIKAKNF